MSKKPTKKSEPSKRRTKKPAKAMRTRSASLSKRVAPEISDIDDLGELPSGYREIFLIARDPHWLYAYWDFDYSDFPDPRELQLKVFRGNELEKSLSINEIARNWYIPVDQADAEYHVVFGLLDREKQWHEIGKTRTAHTPPESISAHWDSEFATVPFHLSFNFLLEAIESAQATGQPLASALGRLQQTGSPEGAWGRIKWLEILLGKDLLNRLDTFDSSEISKLFGETFHAQLDSESINKLLSSKDLASLLSSETSSLFSQLPQSLWERKSLSSEAFSSFRPVELHELASWSASKQAISSERALHLEGLSSIESSWWSGLSSESLSSAQSLHLTSLALSSFGLSSSEWNRESSWSGVEFNLSSWNQLVSESSLFSGFSGSSASGGFSSFNTLSSPERGFDHRQERGFFMHVNAEVIFYGGTDPAAKVTVAGKPVQLEPDGTFRYHFKFPDTDFEVPIVAISPDGKETRSAVLYFTRNTATRGEVTASEQPEKLPYPTAL